MDYAPQVILTPQNVNQVARGLGKVLINAGLKMIASAFSLKPQQITYEQMSNFIRDKLGTEASLLDSNYYLIDFKTWKDIIATDWVETKQYLIDKFDCKVPEDLAFAYGLFLTDGSCGLNKNGKSAGANWRIVNSNLDYLNRAKDALDWEYKDGLTFVIKKYKSYEKGNKTNLGERKQTLYCLEATIKKTGKRKPHQSYKKSNQGKRGKFIEEWRYLFYDQLTKLKITPKPLWDKYATSRKAFLEGVIAGDGSKTGTSRYICVGIKNKRLVVELSTMMESLNWKNRIDKFPDKEFRIYYSRKNEEMRGLACDNFAYTFATHCSELYDISVSTCYGKVYRKDGTFLNYHYWNTIFTKELDGKIHVYYFEPQNSNYQEIFNETKVLMGNMIYEPIKVIIF